MKRKNLMIATILIIIVSAACSLPFTIQTVDDQISTLAAQTVQAWQTQNAPTQTPGPTSTSLPTQTPLPTQTAYPTYTPVATYTLIATVIQAATATPKTLPTATPQPCNQAYFISETIPDGTKFSPGTEFTKSWRLKNTGTCTWNPNYKFVFISGDQMGGVNSVKLDDYVSPGEKFDVLVNLKAPAKPGTYIGYWRLQAADGFQFGQVYVQIKVPSAAFAVTSVKLTSHPASYSGVCPKTFRIKAEITSSAAGNVTYKWKRSDGYISDLKSLKFESAGTKTLELDWKLKTSDTHWIKIYINAPNHQWFGPLDIKVTCS